MAPVIDSNLDRIRELCVAHGVRSLFLFGSAAKGRFDPATSDLDFVVEFASPDLGPWMKRFFEFHSALEALLGRRVDLVLASAIQATGRSAEISRSKVPLYAAA